MTPAQSAARRKNIRAPVVQPGYLPGDPRPKKVDEEVQEEKHSSGEGREEKHAKTGYEGSAYDKQVKDYIETPPRGSIRECVQCSAVNRRGKRCKNRTCIYPEFCHVHTNLQRDLWIKESGIKGAGKGLFTLKDLKPNEKIADYGGRIVPPSHIKSGYGVQVNKDAVMEGASTQSSIARYANTCRGENKKRKECKGQNARLVVNQKDKKVTLRVAKKKKIKAGEEIFTTYGSSYGR